jgi:hypothetical protein
VVGRPVTSVQLGAFPSHAPLHPLNWFCSLFATAVNVTALPFGTEGVHAGGQLPCCSWPSASRNT